MCQCCGARYRCAVDRVHSVPHMEVNKLPLERPPESGMLRRMKKSIRSPKKLSLDNTKLQTLPDEKLAEVRGGGETTVPPATKRRYEY
jgi:hypothetical protein